MVIISTQAFFFNGQVPINTIATCTPFYGSIDLSTAAVAYGAVGIVVRCRASSNAALANYSSGGVMMCLFESSAVTSGVNRINTTPSTTSTGTGWTGIGTPSSLGAGYTYTSVIPIAYNGVLRSKVSLPLGNNYLYSNGTTSFSGDSTFTSMAWNKGSAITSLSLDISFLVSTNSLFDVGLFIEVDFISGPTDSLGLINDDAVKYSGLTLYQSGSSSGSNVNIAQIAGTTLTTSNLPVDLVQLGSATVVTTAVPVTANLTAIDSNSITGSTVPVNVTNLPLTIQPSVSPLSVTVSNTALNVTQTSNPLPVTLSGVSSVNVVNTIPIPVYDNFLSATSTAVPVSAANPLPTTGGGGGGGTVTIVNSPINPLYTKGV